MEKKYNGVLIVCEQNNNIIHKVSYELLGKGIELASKINVPVNCLVLGSNADVNELCHRGCNEVYYIKDECFNKPEEYLYKENIVRFINEYKPEIVLFGATHFGRSLAPRIAASLNTGLTADCTELTINDEGKLIQIRPAFSDNILAHIKTVQYPQMATVRYKEFNEAKRIENYDINITDLKPYYKNYSKNQIIDLFKEEDFDITEAEVVVAGGRGIRNKEDLNLLKELADLLGGVVGATRTLVEVGMIGSSHQVGYSGNRVKPKIYIACGISGAPQHIAGMKDSDLIIAINNDPSAPIFNIANIGYVGDLYDVVPKIIEAVKA